MAFLWEIVFVCSSTLNSVEWPIISFGNMGFGKCYSISILNAFERVFYVFDMILISVARNLCVSNRVLSPRKNFEKHPFLPIWWQWQPFQRSCVKSKLQTPNSIILYDSNSTHFSNSIARYFQCFFLLFLSVLLASFFLIKWNWFFSLPSFQFCVGFWYGHYSSSQPLILEKNRIQFLCYHSYRWGAKEDFYGNYIKAIVTADWTTNGFFQAVQWNSIENSSPRDKIICTQLCVCVCVRANERVWYEGGWWWCAIHLNNTTNTKHKHQTTTKKSENPKHNFFFSPNESNFHRYLLILEHLFCYFSHSFEEFDSNWITMKSAYSFQKHQTKWVWCVCAHSLIVWLSNWWIKPCTRRPTLSRNLIDFMLLLLIFFFFALSRKTSI